MKTKPKLWRQLLLYKIAVLKEREKTKYTTSQNLTNKMDIVHSQKVAL